LLAQTTPERLARLRAFVDAKRSLMRRTLDVEGESGLGLVRIRAEGELDLSLEVEGTMVTVVASCQPMRAPFA